jgi:hydrogenase-4 component B
VIITLVASISLLVSLRPEESYIKLSHILIILSATTAVLTGLYVLVMGESFTISIYDGGFLGVNLKIDQLSSFFLLIVGAVFAISALNSFHYSFHVEFTRAMTFSLVIMYLSSIYAILVDSLIWFVIFWEIGAIAAAIAVISNVGDTPSFKAGMMLFIASLVSSSLLIVAIPHLDSNVAGWIYGLVIVAFGIKSGLVPAHVWLINAHPKAPSPISAILSGAFIKIPIYGLVRLIMIYHPPSWVDIVLAVWATVSLIYASFLTLSQINVKKLFAYSSVVNSALLWLAIAVWASATLSGEILVAAIALSSLLTHAIAHSLFKTSLFLSVGNIAHAMGGSEIALEDMTWLGGLDKPLPITFLTALIASFSAAAVPPLLGFISKWLIISSTILAKEIYISILTPVAVLASLLLAVAFMKYILSVFLAPPRTPPILISEPPKVMLISALIPSIVTVILGVYPYPLMGISLNVSSQFLGVSVSNLLRSISENALVPAVFNPLSPQSPTVIGVFIAVVAVAVTSYVLSHRFTRAPIPPWVFGNLESSYRGAEPGNYHHLIAELYHPPYKLSRFLGRLHGIIHPRIEKMIIKIDDVATDQYKLSSYQLVFIALAVILLTLLVWWGIWK